MARREVMRSSNANGAVTGGTGAAVWPSLEPLLHTPPGQVVNLTMVEGNGFRGMQLHIDTRGSGSGSAHRRQQEEDPEGSGLRGFHAPMQFKVREEVAGLDFGRQIMLPYYPLHLEQHADHGMVTYSQSQRGRVVQSAYHVATMGVGTSVRKCVILLLNTREDVEAVVRNWPAKVCMGDFRALVLQPTMNYEFCREKIQKGAFTIYLYYVKKQGSNTSRLDSWLHLMAALGRMENVTDWAQGLSAAMGQAASLALPFV